MLTETPGAAGPARRGWPLGRWTARPGWPLGRDGRRGWGGRSGGVDGAAAGAVGRLARRRG
jgi:hypothetical protein